MSRSKPVPDAFKEDLTYDSDTGFVYWKRSAGRGIKPGDLAGNYDRKGYLKIKIGTSLFMAHRLIWRHLHGEDPGDMEIDHIDGNPSNNTPSNLRLATRSQNALNQVIEKESRSGIKGVTWMKSLKKWKAQCFIDGKNTYIGVYPTIREAHKALELARKANHGGFMRKLIER